MPRRVQPAEEIAERAVERHASGCTSRRPRCRRCGRHNRSPKRRRRAGPAPGPRRDAARRGCGSPAPASPRRARARRGSSCCRRRRGRSGRCRPAAAAGHRDGAVVRGADRRHRKALARPRQRRGDRRVDLARPRRRPPLVPAPSNALPVQYQRWSGSRPPIIIAARSLPATATERERGSARFIRSPSAGTFRKWVETV